MTDRMLGDALTALADRAEPVDDLAGLTDRALRTAARRRRTRAATGAVVLALAVAVPAAVVAGGAPSEPGVLGPSRNGSPEGGGLPDNTPEERALARACMRGAPADFRLLTTLRVRGGHLVEIGGPRGYVLCVTDGTGNTEPPQLHAWPGTSDGGLFGFGAPLRVDGIRQVQALSGWDELHAVVVGRAEPGVVRVGVAWDGGRTAEAAVRNGFFIAQTPAKAVPDGGDSGAMSSPTIRVVSVTGYDAANRPVHTWRPRVPTEEAGFVPEDCTDGLTSPRPTLCD